MHDFFYSTPNPIYSHCHFFEIFNEKQIYSSLHFLLEKVNPTENENKKTLIVALPVVFGIVFIVAVVVVAVLVRLKKNNSSEDKMISLKSMSQKSN